MVKFRLSLLRIRAEVRAALRLDEGNYVQVRKVHVVLPNGAYVKPVAESHAITSYWSSAAGSLDVRNGPFQD